MSASSASPLTTPLPDWQRRVARAFSRAAPHYARLAKAQLAMGETLWTRLPLHAERLVDLGCGPGHWSAKLAGHYGPGCRVVGLDLAPGMLQTARATHGDRASWLCGDAAALPLPDAEQDLVFSNLAIQWCPDLDSVLAELYRVLRPGGRALINSLGPGTLAEVGQAWASPEALLDFRSRERHLAAARLAGFTQVEVEARLERFHYPDLAAVMASIKGVGAQTARPGARLSRADLARAVRRYERQRSAEGLPVTYHLLTLELTR
ncbi:methyltransferase domain-containing protein [Halomonas campisalis]|uniref:Malonyl-[acyl-carrier protein] O-methyltransferase n=1 Tax=Billgrantia campisalis TaxID=74661 RepID=A0ABS9P3Q4_9GAMM|nr:methyltransferase domain-containing protein [Halomonas campisalis]MCG6656418.1 methyltransferase domain-containing protein [Halomonas campisalis]MDR5861604.1 methyltransferase domain-containing protein [Halomonas campisalis]